MSNAEKTRVEKIESAVDFEAVNQRLDQALESGAFKRRKTLSDVLEKVQHMVLKARKAGVSVAALAKFLRTECDVKVSESSMRNYVRTLEGGEAAPKRRRRRSRRGAKPAAAPVAAAAAVSAAREAPRPSWKKIVAPEEPREARYADGRKVPPRLAHLKPLAR